MEPIQLIYNLVLNTAGLGVLPYLWSGAGGEPAFRQGRLGRYDSFPAVDGSPRVWLHAASVGEVTGAIPTLHTLHRSLPGAAVILSVGTPQGFLFARNQLPGWTSVLPFPLDFPWVLEAAFRHIRPDIYVAMESEFWPNLFRFLHRRRIPSVLLNGRLSRRSADKYRTFERLFRPIFNQFRRLAMLSEDDRRNVLEFGVPPERTLVLGSSKYDGLLLRARPEAASKWRELLEIGAEDPVVIGGSLRGSECTDLMHVFVELRRQAPRTVGVFAPRHMERIPAMARWLREQGVAFQLLTSLERGEEKRRAAVVLVDRIGVLFELYALGDLIFCGGTLEPIGGHNILEPAAWQKSVFYGPHLQKVAEEHKMLQYYQGSFMVSSADDLLREWSDWAGRLSELRRHGVGAGEALKRLGGTAAKQVEIIMEALL